MDQFSIVSGAAHEGAAGINGLPEPTAAQARSGNYRKGRCVVHGLRIAIETPQGQRRTGKASGEPWSVICQAHYGYIEGTRGADGDELDVFVGPWPEAEMVYIVNRAKTDDSGFDEHKILLGFTDIDAAVMAYRNSYERGAAGDQSGLGTIACTIDQLKWWIEFGNHAIPITKNQLPFDGAALMNETTWDSTANPVGVSLPVLLYAMRRDDSAEHLMLDAVTMADVMEGSEGEIVLDAMVIPLNQLERKLGQMQVIMRAAGKSVKPIAMQVTAPFKQRGTTNVAGIFEMSDGQTITVYFHNPDSTPNRLTPDDEMVSWKWLLNKKDVTIVVAPERGRELNPREVARRVMRLIEANSARFAKANTRRTERMAGIEAAKAAVDGKQQQLNALNAEIESLEQRVTEKRNQVAATLQSNDRDGGGRVADPATTTTAPATIQRPKDPGVLPPDWSEVRPGGMATNPDPQFGGIIDSAIVSGLWFAIFHDDALPVLDGFSTRAEAIEAFKAALLKRHHESVAAAAQPDPTSAAGYAKVMQDDALQLANQDQLDAFFNSRSIEVRNSLRSMGWKGANNGQKLSKNGRDAVWQWFQVGAGRNVVGYQVNVNGQSLRDDLKLTAEEFAAKIDDVAEEDTGPSDFVLGAAAAVKAAAGGVSKLNGSSHFTFAFEGEDAVFTDELRGKVEAVLNESVKEVVLPGLDGQVSVVPDSFSGATGDGELAEARVFLATVVNGTADMAAPDLADRLATLYETHNGNAEFDALFSRAAEAYQADMIARAQKALS